uniref:Chromosome 16 open reading frame 74 n=1 Tax=Suricata suricatta TaxID=37032 RepID=A0A673V3P4_SURSU
MGLKLSCLKVWLEEAGSHPEDGDLDPEA